jgi:hypothetical protein
MRLGSVLALVAAGCALAIPASGQPAIRRVTNIEALQAFPGFYHLRPVTIAGAMALGDEGRLRLTTSGGSIAVVTAESALDGESEVRGEFWDVGRMSPDDPRLAVYDLRETFQFDPEGPWPRPGQVTALVASAIVPTSVPANPTIRTLVLHPSRHEDQTVTVTGQFSGRNLLGELPDAPSNSRFDFVLRSAEGAIWVSHIQPRGRDFDLALDARVDTRRWLEVTGVLQQGRGLQWLDASDGSVRISSAPAETTPVEMPVAIPAAPPPEVLFSAPSQVEIDVAPDSRIRIQFSRNVDPETFRDRVRVTYVDPGAGTPLPDTAVEIRTEYRAAARALEITPAEPLAPYRTVRVELSEGILGTDGLALAPWVLTFATAN